MLRSCTLFFLLFFVSSMHAQCYRVSYEVDEVLSEDDRIEVHDDFIVVAEDTMMIEHTKMSMFSEFLRAKAYFRCIYEFPMIESEKTFLIQDLKIKNSDSPIHIISCESSELAYLLLNQQVYLLTSCERTDCYSQYYHNDELQSGGVYKNWEYFDLHAEYFSVYETVEEQVLRRSEYTEIQLVPAQFVLDKKAVIISEQGVCPEYTYTYETKLDSFVSKESYNDIVIQDPVFETTTEEVLVKLKGKTFEDAYLKDTIIRDTVIQVSPAYSRWEVTYDSLHTSMDPLMTVFLNKSVIPSVFDTIRDAVMYIGDCPDGYDDHVHFCTKSVQSYHEYATRTYDRLVTPSRSTSVYVPSVYTHFNKTIVNNSASIPDSCISTIIDSVSYERLVVPATIYSKLHPPVYESRYYEKIVEQEEKITVSTTELENIDFYSLKTPDASPSIMNTLCYSDIDSVLIHKIVAALTAKGVNIDAGHYPTSLFWKPLLTYQSDQNLPIGRIDPSLLEHLSIEE